MKPIAFILAVFLAVHSYNCSMMTLRQLPEDYQPSESPDCGNSWGLIPDTILATYFVMGFAMLLMGDGCLVTSGGGAAFGAFDPSGACFGFTLIYAGLTAVFVGSTTTGLVWASKCRRAVDSHEAWLETESDPEAD